MDIVLLLVGLAFVAIVLYARFYKAQDLFSLMGVYLIYLCFDFFIYPIYCISTDQIYKMGPYVMGGYYILDQQFLSAYTLVILYIVSMLAGYVMKRNNKIYNRLQDVNIGDENKLRQWLLCLLITIFFVYVLLELLRVYGSLWNYYATYMQDRLRSTTYMEDKSIKQMEMRIASLISVLRDVNWYFTLYILFRYFVNKSLNALKILCVTFPQLLVICALGGYRQPFVFLFIVIISMVYYLQERQRRILRRIIISMGMVFILITLLTIIQKYIISSAWAVEYNLRIFDSLAEALSPNKGFDAICGLSSYFGNAVQYMLGESFLDIIMAPIPRSIFQTKKLVYGVDYFNAIMGLPASSTTAITLVGEYYANFSYVGVIVCAMIQGFLMGFADNARFRSPFLFMIIYFGVFPAMNAIHGMGLISVAWMLYHVTCGAFLLWIYKRVSTVKSENKSKLLINRV